MEAGFKPLDYDAYYQDVADLAIKVNGRPAPEHYGAISDLAKTYNFLYADVLKDVRKLNLNV